MATQNLKLVVVGDGGVGKSCLLISHTTNSFPSEYVPTVFDSYAYNVMHNGKPISLGLWDTAGQEDYDRLRPLSYPQTDIFLLCFDISNQDSFENLSDRWLPELRHYSDAPIMLVGCKKDLRKNASRPLVAQEDIAKLAGDNGFQYVETSALTMENLANCFNKAIELGINFQASPKKKKKSKFMSMFSRSSRSSIPDPPSLPPAGKAPWIEIQTSSFADDWQKYLEEGTNGDVIFQFASGRSLHAHKLVLCSACDALRSLLLKEKNQLHPFMTSRLSEFVEISCLENNRVYLTVSGEITERCFVYLLEFLYTGQPNKGEKILEDLLPELVKLADIFQVPRLEEICKNWMAGEEFLNPSIGTYLNDLIGQEMKTLFLQQPLHADVIFHLQDTKIFANKSVMRARSPVMAAMFSGHFLEGVSHEITEVSLPEYDTEAFTAVVEYLYTDHAPIEESNPIEILMLANQLCLSRLVNLCELYITKIVDTQCQKEITKSKTDVIGILLLSQLHNAHQLDQWCLHFISTNYEPFLKRPEFSLLQGENKAYIDEHRWPPLSYYKDLEEYKQKYGKHADTDKCSIM